MNPIKIEGIVFDLDATLVNLGGFVDWVNAYEEIVEHYLAYDCDKSLIEECRPQALFNMLEKIYTQLQKERGLEEAFEIQQTVNSILSKYEQIGANSCSLVDGCVDILDWLKEKEIPLGVCTSNSTSSAETALRVQGIRDYFKVVIGRSVDIPIKPDPAQLEKCFNMLSVDPKNGLVVGDSHKDVIAGKILGAYTVGVPVYFTRLDLMKQAGVDVIIENISELKQVIESF